MSPAFSSSTPSQIVEKVRAQLGPNWKPMVTVRSKMKENVDIYLDMRGDNVAGLLIIDSEPDRREGARAARPELEADGHLPQQDERERRHLPRHARRQCRRPSHHRLRA